MTVLVIEPSAIPTYTNHCALTSLTIVQTQNPSNSTNKKGNSRFSIITNDPLRHALRFLNHIEIFTIQTVCKEWMQIIEQDRFFWKEIWIKERYLLFSMRFEPRAAQRAKEISNDPEIDPKSCAHAIADCRFLTQHLHSR